MLLRIRTAHLGPSLAALAALLLVGQGAAQSPPDVLSAVELREIGPAIMAGRIADLDVVEANPAVWYVGTASGGLWRTRNQGMSWTPLFDDQPCSSVGDVTIDQSNPNLVWVGTGEPQNRNSSPYGCGVFRSRDGGGSWEHMGLEETRHIARIRIHPRNPDVVYVAAVGHLWGPNEERGLYRTTDGGATWEKVLYVDENTGVIDLVMDPSDPRTLFAATYQRRRTGFGFSASGSGSGLWRTTDGGDTWTRLQEGLPEGDLGRIGLDVYRRNGNLLYASVEGDGSGARGLYRSEDRGDTWERVSDNNPRPMYFSMVRIDPNNPDRIYMGGVSLEVSDDGGKTWWERDGAEGVHVDHHALWIDPSNSDHLVLGSDGGVSTSWDGAETWRMHNNLAIGQFYEIGLDMRDPYWVCGGLQDNSSWCGPSNSLTSMGIGNRDWYDVSGGDGFYNRIDPTDWRVVYTESQGGNVSRMDPLTGESQSIRPVARPAGPEAGDERPAEGAEAGASAEDDEEREYRFNWDTPLLISAHDPATVYVGAHHLMRSRDRGVTWEEASPDLTKRIDRDTLAIFGRPLGETHLSRNDGIGSYGNITALAESPLDPGVLWVGTDDGNLQVTTDGGATWTNVVEYVPDVPGRTYVSRIEASHHVPGRAYVSFDGHRNDDYRPYVYVTEDAGRSWRRITTGLPDHSVNVVREHPRTPSLLFAGNEVGAFVSLDRGGSWHRLEGKVFPTVPVDDIAIHPRDNDLVLGTHGRSAWILDDVSFLEAMATSAPLAGAPRLFPVRRATLWARRGGWPFWGDAFFGEDPPDGALIRYWLPRAVAAGVVADAADGGESGDNGANGSGEGDAAGDTPEVRITVLDAGGEPVRTLEAPGDRGYHRVTWDLRHDPPYEAEEDEERGFFRAPRGALVLPGTYTVRLEAGGTTTETEVEVRMDPRIPADRVALEARHRALMDLAALAGPVHEAEERVERLTEQLDEARELLEDRDAPEALTERADSLRDEVREIGRELGRFGRTTRLGSRLESIAAAPTADQLWQIDRAWEEVPPVVERLNRVVERDLPALWEEMDRLGVRPDPGEPVPVPRRPGG